MVIIKKYIKDIVKNEKTVGDITRLGDITSS